MPLTRRDWLKLTGSASLAASLPPAAHAGAADASPTPVAASAPPAAGDPPLVRAAERPMFNLPGQFTAPVKIASVEMLKNGANVFVRTRSTDGAVGITGTKQIEDFIPIFEHLVAPRFIGQDARQLESLIDDVYRANYKLASIPFWCCVAYIEQSLLDMLGKIAAKPVGALLGGVVRPAIPVYLSGSDRVLSAEEEVAVYERGVAATGAKAVKFKIGGRMSRNLDVYPGRTEKLLRLARKNLGDKLTLYADANGSYDVPHGIRIGRLLEELNFAFFEEPCPYEELSETQAVAKALRIPIAYGEQNYSLWQFDWALRHGVMQIVQPDLNYNGGLIRAKRVARLAEKLGRTIVPHNTQTGATSVNILHFASCTPNATPFMEYPWRAPQKSPSWFTPDFKIVNGSIRVPTTPGMGLAIDPAFLAQATVIAKIDQPTKSTASGARSGG